MSDDTFTLKEIEQAIARGLRATSYHREVRLARMASFLLNGADAAIDHIRELGRVLPGVGQVTPGEAARLAYLDSERCIRHAFCLPDLPTDDGHFIKQAADAWPPARYTEPCARCRGRGFRLDRTGDVVVDCECTKGKP